MKTQYPFSDETDTLTSHQLHCRRRHHRCDTYPMQFFSTSSMNISKMLFIHAFMSCLIVILFYSILFRFVLFFFFPSLVAGIILLFSKHSTVFVCRDDACDARCHHHHRLSSPIRLFVCFFSVPQYRFPVTCFIINI